MQLGSRFADYVVVDAKFATAPFLHEAGKQGLRVIARLKDNLPELHQAAQQRFAAKGSRKNNFTFCCRLPRIGSGGVGGIGY
jgi:hypothetical protein